MIMSGRYYCTNNSIHDLISYIFSHFHIVLLIVHGVNILVNISHSFDTGQPMVICQTLCSIILAQVTTCTCMSCNICHF